jgi:hypothetical protein
VVDLALGRESRESVKEWVDGRMTVIGDERAVNRTGRMVQGKLRVLVEREWRLEGLGQAAAVIRKRQAVVLD